MDFNGSGGSGGGVVSDTGLNVHVCGRGEPAPPVTEPDPKVAAAIDVAEALVSLRAASEALHDRDEPDTQAATNPATMAQQKVFGCHDRLDRAVATYCALR